MGWAGAVVAVIGLITGIYKVFFSKVGKERKWRKKLQELEEERDQAYLTDESRYNELNAAIKLHLEQGRSAGYKRL